MSYLSKEHPELCSAADGRVPLDHEAALEDIRDLVECVSVEDDGERYVDWILQRVRERLRENGFRSLEPHEFPADEEAFFGRRQKIVREFAQYMIDSRPKPADDAPAPF